MNKLIVFMVSSIVIVAGVLGIAIYRNAGGSHTSNRLQVVASFYPMAFFASQIAGDLADVRTITPSGIEPHDYEPTPSDISAMQNANIIIVNGTIEPWASSIQENLAGSHVHIVTASAGLITQQDPHVWLDPVLAKQEVVAITQAFKNADSNNASVYDKNSTKLMAQLDNLDASYRSGLAHCMRNDIVTSHAAFGYLAHEYELQQLSIAGLSPDEEPSVKQLSDVATFVRQHNVQYIFFESLVSPKLSTTIATETGANTLELNPLEGLTSDQQSAGDDYFSIMKSNLQNIQLALQCR